MGIFPLVLVLAWIAWGAGLWEPATPPIPVARAADRVFIFQSSFWLNLHHFARAEARRRALNLPSELSSSNLSADERVAWEAALNSYSDLARRNLLFDRSLVQIDNVLAQLGDDTTPQPPTLD